MEERSIRLSTGFRTDKKAELLPHGDIPDAEHGEVGPVVDLGTVRWPLPLEHVPMLGLRPLGPASSSPAATTAANT